LSPATIFREMGITDITDRSIRDPNVTLVARLGPMLPHWPLQ
jgi:hypothetical protein